jgi:hypothetical protein
MECNPKFKIESTQILRCKTKNESTMELFHLLILSSFHLISIAKSLARKQSPRNYTQSNTLLVVEPATRYLLVSI